MGERIRPNAALDDIARELSRDVELEDAFADVSYPALAATSLHVRGFIDDGVIRRVLTKRYCPTIEDSKYKEVGVFEQSDELWIVLSATRPEPLPLEPAVVEQRILELVNAARAEGRRCGDEEYPAAPPVTLSPRLYEAALEHTHDMASRGVPSHEGSDGSHVGERVTRAGYLWQAAGENVAAGQQDVDSVMAAWLESPGHCATLMASFFTQMGVAFERTPSKNPSIYWTQVFAAPRDATPLDAAPH